MIGIRVWPSRLDAQLSSFSTPMLFLDFTFYIQSFNKCLLRVDFYARHTPVNKADLFVQS